MKQAETDDTLPRDLLDAYEVDGGPADFADRVVAAVRAGRARPARRPWRWALVGGALAAAALLVAWPRERTEHGERSTTARESIAVGERAVAVAEPGAEVSWRTTGDAARLEQRAGEVFYRVDGGGRSWSARRPAT